MLLSDTKVEEVWQVIYYLKGMGSRVSWLTGVTINLSA